MEMEERLHGKSYEKKMMEEYRGWFNGLLKSLNNMKLDAQSKAEWVEGCNNNLVGMLLFMKGMEVITDKEYETMCKEVAEEFNTKKLYGFKSFMRAEVFYADRG